MCVGHLTPAGVFVGRTRQMGHSSLGLRTQVRARPAELLAIWYLAGPRQEVQLDVGIGQAVGVHGLQSLQEKPAGA